MPQPASPGGRLADLVLSARRVATGTLAPDFRGWHLPTGGIETSGFRARDTPRAVKISCALTIFHFCHEDFLP